MRLELLCMMWRSSVWVPSASRLTFTWGKSPLTTTSGEYLEISSSVLGESLHNQGAYVFTFTR